MSNRAVETAQQGKRISAASTAAAEKICKLLRWIRKEDYLDSVSNVKYIGINLGMLKYSQCILFATVPLSPWMG